MRTAPLPGAKIIRAGEIIGRGIDKAKGKDAKRVMRFVASDETVDRFGDIIRAEGWELDQFHKNPVLLFGHDSTQPPIGTVEAWVDDKQLLADATFLPEGTSEFADEVWRIVDAGAMRAVSVGFMPTRAPNAIFKDGDEDSGVVTGFEFIGQELLELSVVPVPANPAALALARSVASATTIRRLFADEPSASAQLIAERRRHSIALARLRVGHFNGG